MKPTIEEILSLGKEIDQGISIEGLLISLSGAKLRETACTFAENQGVSANEAITRIEDIRKSLLDEILHYLKNKKVDVPIASLVRRLKRF